MDSRRFKSPMTSWSGRPWSMPSGTGLRARAVNFPVTLPARRKYSRA